ncbi:hypothetical protein Gotur_025083 [Gossypium turneri]
MDHLFQECPVTSDVWIALSFQAALCGPYGEIETGEYKKEKLVTAKKLQISSIITLMS